MKTTSATRIAALAVIVSGILLLVLAPAGDAVSSYRILGFILMGSGIGWLVSQRRPEPQAPQQQQSYQQPVLRWYQSPILWVPIIAALLGLISWLLM
ncbi:hypothetical protein [Pseudidiomarina woesei]|uniref:Uncharacterized protein n=1 Tax=Pseudidiomarina woesei TaxID=1381080 RepID=A0A0K6H283_9GAMM|nr:hypothetical protein [Pseudidiomarina woesei]CUA85073.1 hypothetical protein Ga0061064_1099 [Pseudidiomarina woesei]